jgi:hypothetical protein
MPVVSHISETALWANPEHLGRRPWGAIVRFERG